jgi:hypothetical protein
MEIDIQKVTNDIRSYIKTIKKLREELEEKEIELKKYKDGNNNKEN